MAASRVTRQWAPRIYPVAEKGIRVPDGTVVPGVHALIDRIWPENAVGTRGAGRVRHTRVPPWRIGTATHSRIAAAVQRYRQTGRITLPTWTREYRLLHWVLQMGWRPIDAEVSVYEPGWAATKIDLVCRDTANPDRVIVIEIKTTTQSQRQHKLSYKPKDERGYPRVAFRNGTHDAATQHNRDRLQLLATMRMTETTFKLRWSDMYGCVVRLPKDGGVYPYPVPANITDSTGIFATLGHPSV